MEKHNRTSLLFMLQWILPIILIAAIYSSTFKWMYMIFTAVDSDYSHGFFVPCIVAFLIWHNRKRLSLLPIESYRGGLFLLVIGLLIGIAGAITEVYLISEISLMLVICGFVLYLFGQKIFLALLPALFFLVFMFPLPSFLINQISFPMRIIVTKISVLALSMLGLPVTHKGFEIVLPNTSLVVDTPCSGIRSLISFLAVGYLLSLFLNVPMRKKSIILLMSLPIAIISNILRVIGLSLVAFMYGSYVATETVIHDASGYITFAIGFFLLLSIRRNLK